MIVLDSSAFLAWAKNERGAEGIAARFGDASMSTVNVTEILTKASDWNLDSEAYRTNLMTLGIAFVEFNVAHAALAGHLRSSTRRWGLSLGDRACLALAIERNCPVLTADRAWAELDIGVEIELVR